mgnify:FL=1
MDEKLSFIPKRSLSSQPVSRGGGGGFVFLSFLIFILSAALWGGLHMYKNYLNNSIAQLGKSIEGQKASFEIPTVNEVTGFSEKISVAEKLLTGHKAFSNILDFLQDFTMKDVRFDSLNYSSADAGWPMLTLSGTTKSYGRLAAQIQALEKYNQVKQVSVSGLSSDAMGMVKFNLKIILDPAILAYTIK